MRILCRIVGVRSTKQSVESYITMKGGLLVTDSTIYIIKVTIFFLAILPFLLEIFTLINILRYRKYATNIGKNTNDFFRAIKLRYTNSAKLDINIRSSRSFIEKALLGKGGGIKYIFTIDKICLFIVSINLAVTTIFAIKGHTHFTYIITIMSLCFYLFRQGCSLETHCQLIISMVEDYLENTLFHRVKPAKERSNKISEPVMEERKNELPKQPIPLPSTNTEATVPVATNHIIESILHEFLG